MATDRNLLFGILALQMDFIDRDGLVDALRDWTTQKQKPLGQILVERGSLSVARRELLEPLVDEHVRQHDHDPAASLASVSSISEGTIDWHRVHDVDIAESLAIRRLARNAAGANDTSAPGAERTSSGGNRFRVLRPHAKGGIGEVFLAFDEELHREVALKEIQSRHLRDAANRDRFVREAEVTGGLEHPGIVPVYSLGHHSDGRPFYAMRFIRGDSLKEAIERFHAGPKPTTTEPATDNVNSPTVIKPEASLGRAILPDKSGGDSPKDGQDCPSYKSHITREQFESVEFRKLLGRFIDVCQAIEYAHSRGVLHRDLKPGNIMLGKYGETLVVDWGLAKIAGKEDRFANVDEATLIQSSGSSTEHTADGSIIGTPAYMSPEQAAGKLDQLGPATDVYSLGATLYHILVGRSPFDKLPLREVLARAQLSDFPRPRDLNPSIPKSLEAVCLKAMALQLEDRYTSATAVAEDIEHWLADEPVNACRETIIVQASRWVRKHRAWAISGIVATAIVASISSAFSVWIYRQGAVIQEQSHVMQHQLYAAHMTLAQRAWESGLVGETARLVDLYRPTGVSTSDLRGFEWSYLDRIAHSYLSTWPVATEFNNVILSADGNWIVIDGVDQTIRICNVATREIVFQLDKPSTGYLTGSAISTDGSRVAIVFSTGRQPVSPDDYVINVWNVHPKALLFKIKLGDGVQNVRSGGRVEFNSDGTVLAATDFSGKLFLWNGTSGQMLREIQQNPNASINAIAFSRDGKFLGVADSAEVNVWNVETGEKSQFTPRNLDSTMTMKMSPDLKSCVAISAVGTASIWEMDGENVFTLNGHKGKISSVAYNFDGSRLATAGDDQTIKIWDTVSHKELLTLKGHFGAVCQTAFSSDGMRLISASIEDQSVKEWDAVSDHNPQLFGENLGLFRLGIRPDHKQVAMVNQRSEISVWSISDGVELVRWPSSSGVWSIAFSPKDDLLAVAMHDKTVRIFNSTTGAEQRSLAGYDSDMRTVVFSPEGQRLISIDDRGQIMAWDTRTWEKVVIVKGWGEPGIVWRASTDSQCSRIVTAGQRVRQWDITSGKFLTDYQNGNVWSLDATYSPDGKRFATANNDRTVTVFDSVTGRLVFTLKGHAGVVNRVAFSPDGRRLASASNDRTVKIWDVKTGIETLTLTGYQDMVDNCDFSRDGEQLITSSVDGLIRVWDTRTSPEAAAERSIRSNLQRFREKALHSLAARSPATGWPHVTSSYVCRFDLNESVNDGIVSYSNSPHNRWTTYESPNSTDWFQIEFDKEIEFSRIELGIYDEGPRGGVQTPRKFTVEYWDGVEWKQAEHQQRSPEIPKGNQFNEVRFSPVKSKKVRIQFTHNGKARSGITELLIWPE